MKRFHFERDEDASGVSGVGHVAQGCVSDNGKAVVFWLVPPFTMGVYNSFDDVVLVHGHEGKTRVVFDD